MTTSKLTFQVIQLDAHPPLDPYRTNLFSLWFDAPTHHSNLAGDERWQQVGRAIVSGESLVDWVSASEMDVEGLPDDTPDLFLDELEAVVEDEEGTDLQHLFSMDEGCTE